MTITYTGKVANARLGAFSRLLLYWRGSIYKLMYKEVIIFCGLYALFSVLYRFALPDNQKRLFERISLYCAAFTNLIPLSFVLGFYIAIVVTRWWNQFLCIPWPDRLMMFVTTLIEGFDERSRLIRRTLMRYTTLASLIVLQATSVSVKKRFPTMDHLLEAGVITPWEVKALDDVHTPHGKWWVPFVWSVNLVKEARKEGRIADDYLMKTVLDELMEVRGNLGMLLSYDWISVPLVYTQVTTLAVYTFFLGCLFGRQFLDPAQGYEGHNVDLYVPLFTILQFFFYMGWLKVAEQLINPFGEDDDDFDMNWILDRNMQVSLIVADDLHGSIPHLEKDMYFGEDAPECLPYTKSSVNSIREPFIGSTADLSVSNDGMKVVNPMETIQEGEESGNPPNHFGSHSHFASPYTQSRCESLLSSPEHSRHRMVQTLNGSSLLSKANSYLEGWGQSGVDLQRQLSAASNRLAPLLKGGTTNGDNNADETVSVIITLDGDESPKEHDKGSVLENPALARVRDVDESAARERSSSIGSRKHSFKVTACSESKLAESNTVEQGTLPSPITPSLSTSLTAETLKDLVGLGQSRSAPQTPDDAPAPSARVERQSSSSSVESLPSFSNQSTVTSITPLLLNDHCEKV